MVAAAKSTENASPPSIGFHALTLATFFGASAAPTPLYRIYQENFSLSPVLITVVFAVYAFALLAALLTAGSISDHLGRKPVIFFALVLEIAAMGLFVVASGPGWLIAARIVQGVATGIAGASLGAALVDVDRAKGQIVNSIAPLCGMAVGAVGTTRPDPIWPFPDASHLCAAASCLHAARSRHLADARDRRPAAGRPRLADPQCRHSAAGETATVAGDADQYRQLDACRLLPFAGAVAGRQHDRQQGAADRWGCRDRADGQRRDRRLSQARQDGIGQSRFRAYRPRRSAS